MKNIMALLFVATLALASLIMAGGTPNGIQDGRTYDSPGPRGTTSTMPRRGHSRLDVRGNDTTRLTDTTEMTHEDTLTLDTTDRTATGTASALRSTTRRHGDTTGMLDSTGMLEGGRLRHDTLRGRTTGTYAPGTSSALTSPGTTDTARSQDLTDSTRLRPRGATSTGTGYGTGTTSSTYGTGNTGPGTTGHTHLYDSTREATRSGSNMGTTAGTYDTTRTTTDSAGLTESNRRTQQPGVGTETTDRFGRDVSGSGSTAGTPAPPPGSVTTGTIDRTIDTTDMQKPGDTLQADSTYHMGERIRGSATTDTDTTRGYDVTQGRPDTGTTMTDTTNMSQRTYRGTETDWNTTSSGLQWRDIRIGEGDKAVQGSKVRVRYTGWLHENMGKGRKFDSSIDRNKDFNFTLGAGEVIKGWDEGVVGMREGGIRELLVPAPLAYGATGAGGGVIPPNSDLIFEVELVEVMNQ